MRKLLNKLSIILISMFLILLVLPSAFALENSNEVNHSISDEISNSQDNNYIELNNTNLNENKQIANSKTEYNGLKDHVSTYSESNSQSKNYYISINGNDSNDGSQNSPYLTIKKAIDSNIDNNTINIYLSEGKFTPTLSGNNSILSGQNSNLTLNFNLNIIGTSTDKTILDGESSDWLLNMTGKNNLTISNLTISNFYKNTSKDGTNEGIIYSDSTISLENVKLLNNNILNSLEPNKNTTSTSYLGIIYGKDAVNANNITGINNHINNSLGNDLDSLRKLVEWGGVISSKGNITVKNSLFKNNSASRSSVIFGDTLANINIYNSNFENNIAYYCGGVILGYYNTTVTITNSNFTKNNGSNAGGIVYLQRYSLLNVNNSNFIDNYANTGGALYIHHFSNMTVNNSYFDNNSAKTGGSILGGDNSSVIVNNSIFNNSRSEQGAIMADEEGSILVDNSSFTNGIGIWGGAIHGYGLNNITVLNSYFDNNSAKYGGSIFADPGSNINVNNSIFNRNTAENASAIYANSTNNISKIIVTNSKFENNSAIIDKNLISNFGSNYTSINNTIINNNIKLIPELYNESYSAVAGKNFTVKFTWNNGTPIVGAELKLRLYNQLGQFKDYYSTTNTEGIAKLAIYLISGNWTIECSYDNSTYGNATINQSIIINPVNAILTPSYNHTYKAGSGENFTVNFTSNDTPIVGAELKLRLYNKLGQFKDYYGTTNTEGIAKLPINLIPGTWYIECSYEGSNYIVNTSNGTLITK